MTNELAVFEQKNIRQIELEGEMYYSIIDIIEVLTDSPKPRVYWGVLKNREPQLSTICRQLKMKSSDGKHYKTDCTNTENAFIIIMSVPSSKAHSLKLWLAQAGKEKLHRLNDSMNISKLIFNHTTSNYNTKIYEYKTYLMHDILRGFYKIGKSRNPKVRENTLQAELPTIQLTHVIERDIESYFHKKFNSKRVRGEWFSLSKEDVSYIKSY